VRTVFHIYYAARLTRHLQHSEVIDATELQFFHSAYT
jgi:hypothetical protein